MIRFIDEPGLISPEIARKNYCAKVAVTAFSGYIFDALLKQTNAKPCGEIGGCAEMPAYLCELDGKKILIYKSCIGAPAAAAGMEEVFACGVNRIVAFGICGSLIETPPQTLIVPTRAYRDEGTSYHYLPESEYVELSNAETVKRTLEKLGLHTVCGGTWTTDGFYRETRTRADEMRNNGCIAVDMECSALQAVARFRKKEFYTFFIAADSLAGEIWEPNNILDRTVTDATSVAVAAAVGLAQSL